jgi:YVTN family beta-propeller protein
VYFFGGGGATGSSAGILRVGADGRATPAGQVPQAASDLEAVTLGGTAYVVGGFTGARPLRSIVAFRPGSPPRVAGMLPIPLRYAAVAPVRGRILIAGGTVGTAPSAAVLSFDPASGRVSRLPPLSSPLTHAAGGALRGLFYVIGGREGQTGTQTSRVVAIDPRSGRQRTAGRLPYALSDAAAVSEPGRIAILGGRDATGQARDEILALEPRGARPSVTGAPPPRDVYAADRPGRLSPTVRGDPARIYVPNSESGTVDVIDPASYRVVDHFATGALPQHVTPSWDLKTLGVTNNDSNSLTPIDPRTARAGKPVPVTDPYNLYFTLDGRYAIVVAERMRRLDFRDAHSMRLHRALPVPCPGVDHMDFTADGRYLLASCEFGGSLIVVDVQRERTVRTIALRGSAMPQDVKLSPDGRLFYVADMASNGVWLVDARTFRKVGFVATGAGAHGLYASRDSRRLYVSNRGEGSISVISFRTRKPVAKWRLPGGGSPDMGGVSTDGKVLWLSGRYNSEVYAIDTRSGRLLRRIPVGSGPHGVSVFPQPGRFSLGHTGVFR